MAAILYIGISIFLLYTWVLHLFRCVKTEAVLFLVAGIILPPVGWVHGAGIAFGWW